MPGSQRLNKFYTIEFSVGDEQFFENVREVQIVNYVGYIYPVIAVKFIYDSKRVALDGIVTGGRAKISIFLTTENEDIQKTPYTELDLIILKTITNVNSSINPSAQEFDHPQNAPIVVIAVPENCFRNMNKTVNKVYGIDDRRTPVEAIKSLSETFLTGVDIDISTRNQNEVSLEQLIVPPQTFVQSIRYVDALYGLYHGPSYFSCDPVTGGTQFNMWDMRTKIKETEAYKVHFLSMGQDDNATIYSSSHQDNTYFVAPRMNVSYLQNRNIMKSAYTNRFITMPLTNFYGVVEKTVPEIYENNSIHDGNANPIFNDTLQDRVRVHCNRVGQEDSDAFATSSLSKYLSEGIQISFSLDRNFSINDIGRVGVPILIMSDNFNYTNYTGKYIASKSTITFREYENYFIANATVRLFRGNAGLT